MTGPFTSNRSLVAGTINGIRSWDLLPDGTLEGVTIPYHWTPGLNHAVCAKRAQPQIWIKPPTAQELAPHDVAAASCSCGFYAYTTADHGEYSGPVRVTGIIAASGLVTLGSKGFRAANAQIIALVRPALGAPPPPHQNVWDRFSRWIHDRGINSLYAGWITFCIGAITGGQTALTHGGAWWLLPGLVAPAGATILVAHIHGSKVATAHKQWARFAHVSIVQNLVALDLPGRVAAAEGRYADIPWYDTLDDALAAHPIIPVAGTDGIR